MDSRIVLVNNCIKNCFLQSVFRNFQGFDPLQPFIVDWETRYLDFNISTTRSAIRMISPPITSWNSKSASSTIKRPMKNISPGSGWNWKQKICWSHGKRYRRSEPRRTFCRLDRKKLFEFLPFAANGNPVVFVVNGDMTIHQAASCWDFSLFSSASQDFGSGSAAVASARAFSRS